MPRYTCMESQQRISPSRRSARASPSALLPEAVGPSTATMPGASGAAKAAFDLRHGHAQEDRSPVGAVRAQIDGVELSQQGHGLFPPQDVARTHDAVAGHGGEDVVQPIAGQLGSGPLT